MARQVLENGVVLPAEYSDDWYDDMTSNLTKLDDVIGSDSEKLSSADVGAAALSNNYNDLDNLPTIPTVNDATLTIQKNGVDVQTFTANASSNVTCNITVPTKTSDLTNDSNFVDTSNPAVSSGITSAKVTDYDTHIADTDIHVTTADKNKWNNQTYVFRYSSTALTPSSTNSNALLDNTDNLKVGDKVIDSSGVLFSITAIDTANSTFTIGTALIDLAQDSDVVHKSGDETVGGSKTFSNDIIRGLTTIASRTIKGSGNTPAVGSNGVGYIQNQAILTYQDSTPAKDVTVTLEVQDSSYADGRSRAYFPNSNNSTNLGKSGKRWASVYATNYYYGGSEIEFSQKFVTTDTAQTISGNKTFEGVNINLKSSTAEYGVSSGGISTIYSDKNSVQLAQIKLGNYTTGASYIKQTILSYDSNNQQVGCTVTFSWSSLIKPFLRPDSDNLVSLGTSGNRWKEVYATNYYYGSNNVEFSDKFVTTDTAQTISGNKTFSSINGVEPSSLSLPDLANGIDISSYIDVSQVSTNHYTPPANGWISISVITSSSSRNSIQTESSSGFSSGIYGCTNPNNTSEYIASIIVPCVKNDTVTIYFRSTANTSTIKYAKFFPCQGNV